MIPNQVLHISHRSRFAVAALVDIAAQREGGQVRLGELSARHQVSLTFAEKVFSDLREGALVKSIRGPNGGYCLARDADRICVADVVRAVPGDAARAALQRGPSSEIDMDGDIRRLFGTFEAVALQFLQTITIASLAAACPAPAQTRQSMGYEKRQGQSREKSGVFQRPGQPMPASRAPNSVFALGVSRRITGRGATG